jgi:F-type H+-transporting ATPase subunit b
VQIDWFTFGAQIVNFLVLVALMRLFLYKPIVNAMDRREEKIASRLEEAEQKRAQAKEEATRYREKQRDIDERRDELLSQARDDAEERRQELLQEARDAVEEQKSEWQRAIQREKDTFLERLQTRVSDEVFTVSRRAIRDLADTKLEQRLIEVFGRELDAMPADRQDDLQRGTDEPLEVHSAFTLDEDQRDHLAGMLHDHFGDVELRFVTESDLICGLALVTDSAQIGWNVNDYLHALQENVAAMLADYNTNQEES